MNADAAKPEKSPVELRAVASADDGMRLDRWFRAHFPQLGHGALEKMLRKGQVRVDGGRVKANHRVATGEVVRIPPIPVERAPKTSPKAPSKASPEDAAAIRDMTLYEDDAVLALNKPFGLAVQGGAGVSRHIDAMLAALERNGERPRLVHRLDRDTGGLLILAKTRAAAAVLARGFQGRDVEKTYWALTLSAPRPAQGRIDLPVGKERVLVAGRSQERVTPGEADDSRKKALTDYQTLDEAVGGPAFLALRPHTGRTHQLRVHCAAIGAPIVGDWKYGGRRAQIDGVEEGLHLFCRAMRFRHPVHGKEITLSAPLTGHMARTWRFFGFDPSAACDWPEEAAVRPPGGKAGGRRRHGG